MWGPSIIGCGGSSTDFHGEVAKGGSLRLGRRPGHLGRTLARCRSPAASTLRDELAVSGQRVLTSSGPSALVGEPVFNLERVGRVDGDDSPPSTVHRLSPRSGSASTSPMRPSRSRHSCSCWASSSPASATVRYWSGRVAHGPGGSGARARPPSRDGHMLLHSGRAHRIQTGQPPNRQRPRPWHGERCRAAYGPPAPGKCDQRDLRRPSTYNHMVVGLPVLAHAMEAKTRTGP